MRISLFFVLLFLIPIFGFSSTISCSNAEYAGKRLQFYKLSDPISGKKEIAFVLNFDQNGKCSANINAKQTLYTFSDFGVYRGLLFIEPNKSMELKLPPFREKSFANEKNPYFQPVSFWIHSENKISLNDKVSGFDNLLNGLSDKYFNQLYFQQSKTVFDTVCIQLNQAFPETSPEAFVHHKNLKAEFLRADIFRLRPENYSKIFDNIQPKYWMHPEFTGLFEKTFDKQLSFSAKAIHGKDVNTAVQKQDVTALLSFVKNKYKLSGKMAELVLLKLLHDAFYSGDFSKKAIANMVGSSLFANNSNQIIKTAAVNISSKFSFLETNSLAPTICLNDLSAQKKCTNTNTSKFKYIVFADVETIVCQEHLKYLNRISQLYSKHLEIFVVLRNTDKQGIVDFFKEHEIKVEKLIDVENKYVNEYNIRSFPQCFLFDEQHRVVFTNTKPPLDGFEQQFGSYLQKELFMRQRNQLR